MRQARRRHTSSPANASARRSRPSMSTPVANSQWTASLGGVTVRLEVGGQRLRDEEREEDARTDHEQRRLDQQEPEALPAGVQEGDPLWLKDRPDDSGGHAQ